MSFDPTHPRIIRRTADLMGRYVWIFLGLLLASGCNFNKMTVVSRASSEVPNGSYSLQVTGYQVPRMQVANVLKAALAERGYREVQVGAVPDLLVTVDFGRTTETRNVSTFSNSELSLKSGKDGESDQWIFKEPRSNSTRITVSLNTLHITANRFDPRTGGPSGPLIWSVDVTGRTTGENKTPDPWDEAPILVTAGLKYLGKTSAGIRRVTVNGVHAEQILTAVR